MRDDTDGGMVANAASGAEEASGVPAAAEIGWTGLAAAWAAMGVPSSAVSTG